MRFARVWAMPSGETFSIPPIGQLIKRYLREARVSVDPFARNNGWATYTNDLNPETSVQSHMPALKFLQMLKQCGIQADLILFDPPYTIHQVKELYESIGIDFMQIDAQQAGVWSREKDLCYDLLSVGGVFIHCGYHSNGMGKSRDMEIEELLLVAHGRNHNDTIVTVERKLGHQEALL